MYFVYNDLIPIYDPISGVRTWRMEMLYDCHFNRIIDDFFLTKWNHPEQVSQRYFEISADLHNECTYGLLAFVDITQRQTLASGSCSVTQEWLEDVVLRESSGVTIAQSSKAPKGRHSRLAAGLLPRLPLVPLRQWEAGLLPLLLS